MSETATSKPIVKRLQQEMWLSLLLGGMVVLVWLWVAKPATLWAPIITADIDQHRVSTAVPIPQNNFTIQQSFVPRWDGLRDIELILVRHDGAEANGRFKLQLQVDESGKIIAEDNLDTRFLSHNDTYTFRFPVQRHSAGKRYTLIISGTERNPITVWGYDLEVYGAGQFNLVPTEAMAEFPITTVQELTFTTHYQLLWSDALIALGSILYQHGLLLLLALTFLPLPGLLALLLGPRAWWRWDGLARVGVAYALGACLWPLLWLVVTLLNGRLSALLLWILFIIGWLAVSLLWYRRRPVLVATPSTSRRSVPFTWRSLVSAWRSDYVRMFLLLAIAFAVRLLAVRDLIFPPWVDASRHALITAVMANNGQTISDYAPFLEVDRFPYHYGFHTLSASLHLMLGQALPALLLFLGQLLNGLVPLTIYAAGWLLSKRRDVGVLAAFLVALPFFFPAYYVTWGRLTQLTAVLVLPVLLALTWQLLQAQREDVGHSVWWLVGVLAAGLFLLHFRVFVYYVPFAAVAWLAGKGRNGRWLAASTGLALLLVAPRLIQLVTTTEPVQTIQTTISGYNTFPTSYVTTGWERQFIILAAIGLIIAINGTFFRQKWALLPNILALWVGILFLLLAGPQLGLPQTSLLNLNSMYIIIFVPLALFLALTLLPLWRQLGHAHWLLSVVGHGVVGGVLLITVLFGIQQQVTILNQQTILARPADLAGLTWLDDHLPPTATVAVNSWLWLGNTWAVSDGGGWLLPLSQRRVTTPPADYIYSLPLLTQVNAFNESATAVANWSDPASAEWLQQQGVTHIFVGARGGFFNPLHLSRNPRLTMLYGVNGVFIFAIDE